MTLFLLLASLASAETVVLPAPMESTIGSSHCMTLTSLPDADRCGLPAKLCVWRVSARIMKNRWGELVMLHGGMRFDDAVKTPSIVSVEYEADGVLKTIDVDQVVGPRTPTGHRVYLTFEHRLASERLACGVTIELDMTRRGHLNHGYRAVYGWTVDPSDDSSLRVDAPYRVAD